MAQAKLTDSVRAFLDAHSTATLACADRDGPWAAAVYYVRSDRDLFFFSSPESRHSIAFHRDPRAAAEVHAEAEDWRDLQGVQLSGRVEDVTDAAEKAKLVAAYLVKFPFARNLLGAGADSLSERVRCFRLTPERLYFVDNRAGLGNRSEVAW